MPSVSKLRINGVEYDLSGGGGGGTSNYNDLSNKPQINGNTLSGNKTSSQLGFGTASAKDVPESGDAGSTEVVMGNDTRLSDSRPASDVYSWAKAATKPTYTKSEVGLSEVGNFKAVSTVANQGLTATEKSNARANIGAGTGNSNLALGETSSTAYYGDKGKTAYDHSQSDHSTIKPAFTEASTRANIATGESIATIFGKIKKFFTELKTVAFTGSYNDLSDKPTASDVNAIKFDGDLRDLGSDTPAAATKTYFDNNVANNKVEGAYNSAGNEYSMLFGRGSSAQYGNILKWGYADKYLYILRKQQNKWKSNDWEKISAGYADTAGSATDSTKVAKAGDTMTGKLTANGRLASPTSGGTYISQKDPTKAALNITTDAVVNESRYDSIIAGKSTDDSTWSIGIIDNTICFGRFSSSQTDNNFTNVIRIPLATKTGTVATTTELTNGSVTKVGTGNVGSATNPMYLNAGVPTACSYSLNKSVPSDAKFTDTTYNFAGNTFYSGDQNSSEHNANNAIKNGHYYYTSNGPSTDIGASTNDGALYVQQYSDSWVAQIAQDYLNGNLFVRGKNNGTWKSWVKILHERCDSPSFLNGITIYDDTPVSSVQTRVNTAGVETRGTVKVIGSGSEYNYSELRDDGVYINGTPLQPKIPVNPSSSEKQYLTFWIEVDYEPLSTPN